MRNEKFDKEDGWSKKYNRVQDALEFKEVKVWIPNFGALKNSLSHLNITEASKVVVILKI